MVLAKLFFDTLDKAHKLRLKKEMRMAAEDDDKPRRKISHEIGQDLSLLSVDDLNERITLLTLEAERLKAEMVKKRASRDAADNFFKS